MNSFVLEEIQQLYKQHPLREDRILSRIAAARSSLAGLTELDLAIDPVTEITDQNHIGGTEFVDQMAEKCRLGPHSTVLDLGCGLGGSIRYLAYRYGCRGIGIDISRERCIQAESLTRLVGLQNLVEFQFGDMIAMSVPPVRFDILWGQGSWVHLSDKQSFLNRWSPCIKQEGRIAMEDACLRRNACGETESKLLVQLEQSWKANLVAARIWLDVLEKQGYTIEICDDLSNDLFSYYAKLIHIDERFRSMDALANEKDGWRNAVSLTESGVLGYCRVIARKLR